LVVVIGVAALAGVMVVRACLRPGAGFVVSIAYLPVVLFLLWALLQLAPLPAAWVKILSPHAFSIRRTLLPGFDDHGSLSLSLYRLATKDELLTVLCPVAVFVVVLNSFHEP